MKSKRVNEAANSQTAKAQPRRAPSDGSALVFEIICRSSAGKVTNHQTRAFDDPKHLGEFILCQQNNPETRHVEVLLPGCRVYHPSRKMVRRALSEAPNDQAEAGGA